MTNVDKLKEETQRQYQAHQQELLKGWSNEFRENEPKHRQRAIEVMTEKHPGATVEVQSAELINAELFRYTFAIHHADGTLDTDDVNYGPPSIPPLHLD